MEAHHIIRLVKGLHNLKVPARTVNLKLWDVVSANWLVRLRGGQQPPMMTDNKALGHELPQTI
jgi:hypothetical protein